ncbi:MAG: fused MFS/spermidine synthase [Pseudomonadota bacterium]|nr:fused MFS/spermidine synthase [Pseudomonadota bacterium]
MALLQQFKTDFGIIRVTRSRKDGGLAYYQNGCFHSQANKSGVSVCAYVHVIHEIIRHTKARRVLLLGCAGGTLATMLHRLRCKVTVVDINPVAFAIARRYFGLPPEIRCVRRDGIAYVHGTTHTYDAVVVDVFGSHNEVPRSFTTRRFFEQVAAILSPSGVMVMNVITRGDGDRCGDKIAREAEKALSDVRLLDWPGQTNRNTLVTAGPLRRLSLPSGYEPAWIREDLAGLIRRRASWLRSA